VSYKLRGVSEKQPIKMQDRKLTVGTPLMSYLNTSLSHKQVSLFLSLFLSLSLSLSLNVKAYESESLSLLAMKKKTAICGRETDWALTILI